MVTYEVNGLAVRGRERYIQRGGFATLAEAKAYAFGIKLEAVECDLAVCECDSEREAREGGHYAPRIVSVVS